eukprot:gene3018-2000_t
MWATVGFSRFLSRLYWRLRENLGLAVVRNGYWELDSLFVDVHLYLNYRVVLFWFRGVLVMCLWGWVLGGLFRGLPDIISFGCGFSGLTGLQTHVCVLPRFGCLWLFWILLEILGDYRLVGFVSVVYDVLNVCRGFWVSRDYWCTVVVGSVGVLLGLVVSMWFICNHHGGCCLGFTFTIVILRQLVKVGMRMDTGCCVDLLRLRRCVCAMGFVGFNTLGASVFLRLGVQFGFLYCGIVDFWRGWYVLPGGSLEVFWFEGVGLLYVAYLELQGVRRTVVTSGGEALCTCLELPSRAGWVLRFYVCRFTCCGLQMRIVNLRLRLTVICQCFVICGLKPLQHMVLVAFYMFLFPHLSLWALRGGEPVNLIFICVCCLNCVPFEMVCLVLDISDQWFEWLLRVEVFVLGLALCLGSMVFAYRGASCVMLMGLT